MVEEREKEDGGRQRWRELEISLVRYGTVTRVGDELVRARRITESASWSDASGTVTGGNEIHNFDLRGPGVGLQQPDWVYAQIGSKTLTVL